MTKPVRTLVIDGSSARTQELERALRSGDDMTLVDGATHMANAAREVERLRPDVVIVDLLARNHSGVQAIEEIMARVPTPILVLTNASGDESTIVVEALAAGALEALPLPDRWEESAVIALRARLRLLGGVVVVRHLRRRSAMNLKGVHRDPAVAIGASAGGPAALAELLSNLAGLAAPVLVVQHLHPDFVSGFVSYMRRASALPVENATDGACVRDGVVYLAPAGLHLRLSPQRRIVLDPDPPLLHRPAVDELFRSVADLGSAGIGVVLTGMGEDGAAGLLEMRNGGAITIAQDEASSAVFGMPAAAVAVGAAGQTFDLKEIPQAISRAVRRLRRQDGTG